jgi:hypothetical protein
MSPRLSSATTTRRRHFVFGRNLPAIHSYSTDECNSSCGWTVLWRGATGTGRGDDPKMRGHEAATAAAVRIRTMKVRRSKKGAFRTTKGKRSNGELVFPLFIAPLFAPLPPSPARPKTHRQNNIIIERRNQSLSTWSSHNVF